MDGSKSTTISSCTSSSVRPEDVSLAHLLRSTRKYCSERFNGEPYVIVDENFDSLVSEIRIVNYDVSSLSP